VKPIFKTKLGKLFVGKCEEVLPAVRDLKTTKARLLFTSPPFPLKRKKRYGNLAGEEYVEWIESLALTFANVVADDGSIVIEMGNAWEPLRPVQSLLPIKALMRFVENKQAGLRLCQEFVCYNPARLPSPAQWVTIDRIRVKDSFTRVWWMAKQDRPLADNRRVLKKYSQAMEELLERQSYNHGKRPSEHVLSKKGFLQKHEGSIPPNVVLPEDNDLPEDFLEYANTGSVENYQKFCRDNKITSHPARMPPKLAEFFIKYLTKPGDLVIDPFGGSNTVGHAAERLGRKWLTVEANPLYAAASIARFDIISATAAIRKLEPATVAPLKHA
jgi:DNA modification methylase